MTSYMPKSKSDIHETPDNVYHLIKQKWGHDKGDMFDPCPINPKFNGLETVWTKLNYVNPPYTLLKEFVYQAIHEADLYWHETIMLLPSKTDQQWFHDLKPWWSDIQWIRRRLKFKNNKWSAPQPHFLVKIK